MPMDDALASLRKIYNLRDEMPREPGASTGREHESFAAYEVWSFGSYFAQYVGEVVFKEGKLWAATKDEAWATSHGGVDLVDAIFKLIYENSGRSTIEEPRGGELTRTRSATAILETIDQIDGKFRFQTLKIVLRGKLFTLALTTHPDGSQIVRLDTVIVAPDSTPPGNTERPRR